MVHGWLAAAQHSRSWDGHIAACSCACFAVPMLLAKGFVMQQMVQRLERPGPQAQHASAAAPSQSALVGQLW